VWSIDELRGAWKSVWLAEAAPTARLVIGLGGLMGLRPTEIIEARLGDVSDGLLTTGRKTTASHRIIPIPETVKEALKRPRPRKAKTDHLVIGGRGTGLALNGLNHFMKRTLGVAPKFLRKSFTSAMIRQKAPPELLEAYIGHEHAMMRAVTSRHYMAEYLAEEMRVVAEKVDNLVTKKS
jgi:integrase